MSANVSLHFSSPLPQALLGFTYPQLQSAFIAAVLTTRYYGKRYFCASSINKGSALPAKPESYSEKKKLRK